LNQVNLLKDATHTIETITNVQTETEEIQSKIGFRKESDYFSTKERRGTEGDLNSESGTTRQIKRVRTTSTGRKIMIIKENNKSEEISPFGKSGLVGLPTLIQEGKTLLFKNVISFSKTKREFNCFGKVH